MCWVPKTLLDLLPPPATVGTFCPPLCSTPSDFRWGLIFDQTASLGTLRMCWGYPQASMGAVSPIPRIVACGVWGVGPLSLFLQRCCLPAVWGSVSCLLLLYGLVFWGCTIPLRGGGFDGESTLLAWATGWRQPTGARVTPVGVWGVSTEVVELAGCRLSLPVGSRHIEP